MRWKRSIFSVNGVIDQGGRTGVHDLLEALEALRSWHFWNRKSSLGFWGHASVAKLQCWLHQVGNILIFIWRIYLNKCMSNYTVRFCTQLVYIMWVFWFQAPSALFTPRNQTNTVLLSVYKQYSISTNMFNFLLISSMSKLKFSDMFKSLWAAQPCKVWEAAFHKLLQGLLLLSKVSVL